MSHRKFEHPEARFPRGSPQKDGFSPMRKSEGLPQG
ncbi:hypothetical protein vseg_005119 [Gypsophila vaccaria]